METRLPQRAIFFRIALNSLTNNINSITIMLCDISRGIIMLSITIVR
ncbi:MAG: hypothetical protein K0Q65_1464 [Clostridia bacterium]|jgi:hypothetical protein|nr:hypothetical protein [Clostridia bacterium]